MLVAHLFSVDELKRAEGGLEVGGVGLEVAESAGDADLQLAGAGARRAVRRDLVKRGRHDCGFCADGLAVVLIRTELFLQ